MKLSIVIVTYTSAEVISNCLASIPVGWDSQNDDRRQTTDDRPPPGVHHPSSAVETIVVDNGSTDGTVEIIQNEFPAVRLFSGPGNLMFAGGNNYGFKQATAPLIFMLNPDTVVHPSALRKLVDFADAHPEAGMI
ncbi:MAG: glycosyltransferase, partial [Chloroflexota bacterium]